MDVERRHGVNCAFITGIVTTLGWATLLPQLILLPNLIERFILDGSNAMKEYHRNMVRGLEREWLLIILFCAAGVSLALLSTILARASRPQKKGKLLLGSGLALSVLIVVFLRVSYIAEYNSFGIYGGWFLNIVFVVTAIMLGGVHASIHSPNYRPPRVLVKYTAPYLFLAGCFFIMASVLGIVRGWKYRGPPPIEYSFFFLFFSIIIALMSVLSVINIRKRDEGRFARKVILLTVIFGFLIPALNLLVVAVTFGKWILSLLLPMSVSWAVVIFAPAWIVGCAVSTLFHEHHTKSFLGVP